MCEQWGGESMGAIASEEWASSPAHCSAGQSHRPTTVTADRGPGKRGAAI